MFDDRRPHCMQPTTRAGRDWVVAQARKSSLVGRDDDNAFSPPSKVRAQQSLCLPVKPFHDIMMTAPAVTIDIIARKRGRGLQRYQINRPPSLTPVVLFSIFFFVWINLSVSFSSGGSSPVMTAATTAFCTGPNNNFRLAFQRHGRIPTLRRPRPQRHRHYLGVSYRPRPRVPQTLLMGWSRMAQEMNGVIDNDHESFSSSSPSRPSMTVVVVDPNEVSSPSSSSSSSLTSSYDLTSPREWLEWREDCSGCPGAYTVMRCDVPLRRRRRRRLLTSATRSTTSSSSSSTKTLQWNVWGLEFHLKRLQASYLAVQPSTVAVDEHNETANCLHEALQSSQKMVDMLLNEALAGIGSSDGHVSSSKEEDEDLVDSSTAIVTVMLTLLWEPQATTTTTTSTNNVGNTAIQVWGHACSSLKPSVISSNVNPNPAIDVAIGYLPYDNDFFLGLPNRYDHHPEAKLSSWCRERRPLEELFKTKQQDYYDIGEVLLTRLNTTKGGDYALELLEGLTSNLFVVYPEKVLRTPPGPQTALEGYARQLVLDCAQQCGYRVDIQPIDLDDVKSWCEVFMTSSIRLIVPVKRILCARAQKNTGDSLQLDMLWDQNTDGIASASGPLASECLYHEILKINSNKKIDSLH